MVRLYRTIQLMGRSPLPGQVPQGTPFTARSPPRAAPSGISRRFQRLSRSRGQVNYVLRTRPPLSLTPKCQIPSDLHVLGTPPTFILSQDQTRRLYPFSKLHIHICSQAPGCPAPRPVATGSSVFPATLLSNCVARAPQGPAKQHLTPTPFPCQALQADFLRARTAETSADSMPSSKDMPRPRASPLNLAIAASALALRVSSASSAIPTSGVMMPSLAR